MLEYTSLSLYNKKHTLRGFEVSSIQSIRHSRYHQLQNPQFRDSNTRILAENPGFISRKPIKPNSNTNCVTMVVLPKDYHDLIVDCTGREREACSSEQNQDQTPPKKGPCDHDDCVKSPTIIDKQNVKEGEKQEKEEKQDGGKTSGN